ncbi:unnamed protein product [Schistosoma mattheei]|uniref:Reverse transcriptase domain-containing protein n=1 Tax=Schistosoma mattheei TaxID=31246 RepID=A0AA85BCE7_9TREM|nr:unnamed protein product [Schistosoma mattheei]
MLLRPDKGSSVVILNRDEYINKVMSILNNSTRFIIDNTQKDLTYATEKRVLRKLRELVKKNLIDNHTYNELKPKGSQLPYLYGLPKTHKPDIPIRPILSMAKSPFHKLARWFTRCLEPVRKKLAAYSLKDSFEFVQKLDNLNVSDKFMVSFDVSSLFTNIPLEETVEIICEYPELLPLPPQEFKQLLFLCTKNIQFKFNNFLYRQIDGIAMGSPLGPILADIFMGHLEQKKLKHAIDSTTLYCRYMDDTFPVRNNHQHSMYLLSLFSKVHKDIEFTMEHEVDDKFHFLDIGISRTSDGTLQRHIHRKNT